MTKAFHFRLLSMAHLKFRVVRVTGVFFPPLIYSLEGNPLLQIEVEPTSEVRIGDRRGGFGSRLAKLPGVVDDAEGQG